MHKSGRKMWQKCVPSDLFARIAYLLQKYNFLRDFIYKKIRWMSDYNLGEMGDISSMHSAVVSLFSKPKIVENCKTPKHFGFQGTQETRFLDVCNIAASRVWGIQNQCQVDLCPL